MKTALAALALGIVVELAGACAGTPPPLLALPGSQVRDGVRIEITALIGSWTRPVALAGTVENVTAEPIAAYSLRFDGLGYQGAVIGSASTEIQNLGPRETRRFRADFPRPTPHGLHQVMIAQARARR